MCIYSSALGVFNRLLALLALAFSVASLASDAEEASVNSLLNMSLEELLNYEVVAPTKSSTRLSDTPGAVSVITYDQIRNSSARTIPELLRLVPGVHVRWNPMVQSIELRSFGSNPFTSKVLLLIDGIPYNSWNKGGFPQHPGFDFFNIENVKHLEVIRGAGSALYGENALNGVINIVTLSGEEYRQTRASVFAGNRDTQSVTVSHGSQIGEDGAIFVSARAEEGQLPMEMWRESDAKAKGQDLFIKGSYKGLQLSYYRRQDKFDGYDDLIIPPANARFASVEEIEQDINIVAVNHNHEAEDGSWYVQSNVSYADREGTHCGGCHAAPQSEAFHSKIDHGYQLFGNTQVGINTIENHAILLGAEFRRNSAGDSFDQVSTPSDPEGRVTSYRKAAYFVQDHITFPKQRMEAVLGLRYDSATSPDLLGDEVFPRIALIGRPTDKLTLRGGWSEAARYPTFVELYQNTFFFNATTPGSTTPIIQTDFNPNPDLVPETLQSFEFGAEYHFSKHLQSRLDLFYNLIDDPIVLVFGPGTSGFENHPGKARVRGFETEIRYSPNPKLSSFLNWSYQEEKQQGSGVDSVGNKIEFSYAPRHKVNAGLTYQAADALNVTLEWSWRDSHIAPQFWSELAFGDPAPAKLDAYSYLNVRARYRLPFDMGNNQQPLTLSFYGKNLSNETPTETLIGGDGHLAEVAGRSFFIGLDYEWAN